MSSNWPDKPLIRIIRGEINGEPIANKIATRTEGGNFAIANLLCVNNHDGDSISEWEEVTAVLEVLSHLPADKPTALDQAVTDVESIGARGVMDAFTTDDRVALLLNALDNVHTGTDTRYRLAWVVLLAYTWADLADPDLDALADIRSCAARLLETGPLEDPSIIPIARSAGLVAGRIAHKGLLREALVDLGAYALTWAAEIIAQEETGEGEDR